jgi:hypothetical protein
MKTRTLMMKISTILMMRMKLNPQKHMTNYKTS